MVEFNPVLGVVTATKPGAARRQLEVGISAFEGGDYAVAITLAGAAEGMLPEDKNQPLFSRLRDHPDTPPRILSISPAN
jgi:hypothetical protein